MCRTPSEYRPRRIVPRPTYFLAHLIATNQHAPQTCERRRATPAEATAAYADVIARLRG